MTPQDMEAQIAEIAADNAAIEDYRAKFGDEKAAQFAADLYKLRRTPAPASAAASWSGLPRSIIILIAIWVGLLETADKLPRLLLAYPGYEATLAEYQAKMMQPDLVQAQLEKAKLEAKASAWQPALTAAQAFKAEIDAEGAGSTIDRGSTTRISNMFDLLDPEHPSLVSRGALEPDIGPLVLEIMRSNARKAKNSPPNAAATPQPDTPAPAPPKAEASPPPTDKPASSEPPPPPAAPKVAVDTSPPSEPTPAPAPAPAPLRTPKNFDCVNGKHMGTDYVICASPQLLDALARLEDVYDAVRAGPKGDAIKTEQIEWIKRYGGDCGLPYRGRPTDDQIQSAAGCIGNAIEQRIKKLQAEQ